MRLRWALYLTLMLFCASCAHAAKASLSQEDYGICNPLRFSTTQTGATLATAIASTGSSLLPDCSTTTVLLIPPSGTWTIASNLSIPARFTVRIPAGASITINSGVTLTLGSVPDCDVPSACIVGAGTLTLTSIAALTELRSAIFDGCFNGVPSPGSLTLDTFACSGRIVVDDRWPVEFSQATSTVGPFNGGNGTYWLAVHRTTSGAITGWTRQGSTHYLWQLAGSRPANANGAYVVASITVAGGAITAVTEYTDRIFRIPVTTLVHVSTATSVNWYFQGSGYLSVDAGKIVNLGSVPKVAGNPRRVFYGSGIVRVGNQQPSSPHWWGAVGDGTTDDTAAFNAATQYTVSWVAGLSRAIVLESGLEYFIAGTVYVRAGQTLTSQGPGQATIKGDLNAVTPNVYAGVGFVGGFDVSDGGFTGRPTSVTNLFFSQGSVTSACLKTSFSGVYLSKLFMSNCGTGIEVTGGDIVLSDIIFDLGLVGMYIHDAQNVVSTNLIFYNQNYGLIFGSNIYDVQFTNTHFEYVKYVGIHFPGTSTSIRNVHFDGLQMIQNVQYGTITAMILANTGDVSEASFTNCVFRNMYGYAVNLGNIGGRYSFRSCIFDGLKTNPAYDQSTTAGGIVFEGALLELKDVDFRNLATFALAIGGTANSEVNWDGGKIETGIAGYLPIELTNSNAQSILRLGNIRGPAKRLYTVQSVFPVIHTAPLTDWFFPPVACPGSRLCWFLPYQKGSSYEVTITANISPFGDVSYRKQSTYGINKSNDVTAATKTSYLTTTLLHRNPATDLVVLDVAVEFTTAGSGTSVTPLSNSGVIAISVPDTYNPLNMTARQLIP